jgi:hypothetical protein
MAELAEIQQYKTKNILLEHPADWYIEKKLLMPLNNLCQL